MRVVGSFDFLAEAIADIDAEMAVLNRQLAAIEQKDAIRAERASIPERLTSLAEQARTRLAEPSDELMA